MTPNDNREQQQAELLWRYIEELRQADNPDDVQFVAVTSGECAEVVGLMKTAAEASAAARAESAPNCRREAVRRRLRDAIASAPASQRAAPAAEPRSSRLPEWLTVPLTGRSTGWAVAVAALLALVWFMNPRTVERPLPESVLPLSHQETLDVMPDLVAGRLDSNRTLSAMEHLKHCRSCLELYEAQLRATHPRPQRTGQYPWGFGDGLAAHPVFTNWGTGPRQPKLASGSRLRE